MTKKLPILFSVLFLPLWGLQATELTLQSTQQEEQATNYQDDYKQQEITDEELRKQDEYRKQQEEYRKQQQNNRNNNSLTITNLAALTDDTETQTQQQNPTAPVDDAQSVTSLDLEQQRSAKRLFNVLKNKNIRKTCKMLFKVATKDERQSFEKFLLNYKGKEAKDLKRIIQRANEIRQEKADAGFWGGLWSGLKHFFVPSSKMSPYKQAYLEEISKGAKWYQRALAVCARPFAAAVSLVGGLVTLSTNAMDTCTEVCDWILTAKNPFVGFGHWVQQTAAVGGIATTAALGAALIGEGLISGGVFGLLGGFVGAFSAGFAGFGVYYLLKYFGYSAGKSLIGALLCSALTMYLIRKGLKKYYRYRSGKKKRKKTKSKKVLQDSLGYYFLDDDNDKIHINVH